MRRRWMYWIKCGGRPVWVRMLDNVGIWTLGYAESMSRKAAIVCSLLRKARCTSDTRWCTAWRALQPCLKPYIFGGRNELDSSQCSNLLLSMLSTSLRMHVARAIGRSFEGSFFGIAIIREIFHEFGIRDWVQRALSILQRITKEESERCLSIL